ncbi:hypothetical protein BSR28_06960 [Boudabousia liubingyangii]|uniref:hypothetical protein n=1 Tax=Boudabousia liubingyangii TaxID=1921764 RepID=UPI00096921BF|nr:hypothetical protein [Boudabousia liubingyangii]OKL46274.1 hypothetical protein BSR28_06960 [Boudabousia liubingyangii]
MAVWHYTGLQSAISILQNGCFWVSHSQYLNDPSETLYGLEIILSVLQDKTDKINKQSPTGPDSLNSAFDTILSSTLDLFRWHKSKESGKRSILTMLGLDSFILSFTRHDNSSHMWNYSTSDSIALSFDFAPNTNQDDYNYCFVCLCESCTNPSAYSGKIQKSNNRIPLLDVYGSSLQEVIYDAKDSKVRIQERLVSYVESEYPDLVRNLGEKRALDQMLSKALEKEFDSEAFLISMLRESAFHKNSAWNSEAEERLVFYDIEPIHVDFRTSGEKIIPYLKVGVGKYDKKNKVVTGNNFKKYLLECITEIKIGPSPYQDFHANSIKKLLEKLGHNIPITLSNTPFRRW